MTPTILYIILGLVSALGIALGLYFHEKTKALQLLRQLGISEGLSKLKELEKLTDAKKQEFTSAYDDYVAKYGDPSKKPGGSGE